MSEVRKDRSQEAEWRPGEIATYLHEARGGYGYVTLVDAEIVRVGPKRVLCRLNRRGGGTAERWLSPTNLRRREVDR